MRLLGAPSASPLAFSMDLLPFSVGGAELFAIDVFKLAEVVPRPRLFFGARGAEISLRGVSIPAVDGAELLGAAPLFTGVDELAALVCAYNGRLVAYVVRRLETVARVAVGAKGRVELPDGRQALVVEWGPDELDWVGPKPAAASGGVGFYANGSETARGRIQRVFDALGLPAIHACDAQAAWEKLDGLARAGAALRVILIEAELPPLDGCALARRIRADSRFDGVPIAMHSSSISRFNAPMAAAAGVDRQAERFDSVCLAEVILGGAAS